MVREYKNGPTFIQQVNKLTNVIVRLNIDIFCKLNIILNRQSVDVFWIHVFIEHMPLQVDTMIM